MGARPEQCSCCPQCPEVLPVICPADDTPAVHNEPATYRLNDTGDNDWNLEKFSTSGVSLGAELTYPLVFIDKIGQRFDPITTGAARLNLTATPSGVRRWIAGALFWPAATVTPPDILSHEDGPIVRIGCADAKLRFLRNGLENIGTDTESGYLFSGAAVKHRGKIYIQPEYHANYSERCWQNLALVSPMPAAGDPTLNLAGRFRRGLVARDRSDSEITRLPEWPAGAGYRTRDRLFELDKDADPVLIVDERPEDWLEEIEEFGFWIGLSDIRLDLLDGFDPPRNLGQGIGTDEPVRADVALDNLCLEVKKEGLYRTRQRYGDGYPRPPEVDRYGRGENLIIEDPLDYVPTFGAGPDEWHTLRYQEDVAPQGSGSAKADNGFLTWTEETPGFQGYRPITLATPYTVPPFLGSQTWRLCCEWTYREISYTDRNHPAGPQPPPGSTYRRQSCGVGVPGLFGAEILRDQWTNSFSVVVRTPGPTPYWVETLHPANPPADWNGNYPDGEPESPSGTFFQAELATAAPVPFDGSRIAVVCCPSRANTGFASKYRIDIEVFVEGYKVSFPSIYTFSTGTSHQNDARHPHNRVSWNFLTERIYLIGKYGGAWQDLKVTHTP